MVMMKDKELTPEFIGTRVRKAREWAEITQAQLGERLGCNRWTVWKKEKGENGGFTAYEIANISQMFGQNPSYFYGGKFDPEAIPEVLPDFRPRSVAQNSGKQNGSSRKTGESGGARTLDTRIKSPAPLALNFANLLS